MQEIFYKFAIATSQKLSNLTVLDHLLVFALSIATLLIGTWTDSMSVLIALQVVDVVTGLMKGKRNRAIASRELKKGAKGKFGAWLYIIVGNTIDGILAFGSPIAKTFVVSYLVIMELISIVENAETLGAPKVPTFLTKYLAAAKDKLENVEIGRDKEDDN